MSPICLPHPCLSGNGVRERFPILDISNLPPPSMPECLRKAPRGIEQHVSSPRRNVVTAPQSESVGVPRLPQRIATMHRQSHRPRSHLIQIRKSFPDPVIVRNNFTGWVGAVIRIGAAPVIVSELGRWKLSGSSGTHIVKIVQENQADLPGATTSVNLAGNGVRERFPILDVSNLPPPSMPECLRKAPRGIEQHVASPCRNIVTSPQSVRVGRCSTIAAADCYDAQAKPPAPFPFDSNSEIVP